MMIGAVRTLLKRAKYMKSVLKKYRGVLSPGKYRLFDNFRSVCLDDPSVCAEAFKCFPVDGSSVVRMRMARMLNKIGYLSLRCPNSTAEYDAVYVANNYNKVRETKLFSFPNRKILTFCTSYEQMNKQLQEYDQLHHAYKMPAVEQNRKFENALNVAMIHRLDFPGDNRALTAIAEATVSYNPDVTVLAVETVKELIAFSYDDETMSAHLAALTEGVDAQLQSATLPICMQHGDLSKDNLIFGESEGETAFWWIDWEHRRDRVFFYDYFFYMLNSALYKDVGAFECYMSGEHDETLRMVFSHYGLAFDPSHKWNYFLVAAIVFLKERVCDLGNMSALVRYCDLIKILKAKSDGDIQ